MDRGGYCLPMKRITQARTLSRNAYRAPGVYVEEISGGVRSITAVATSITVFIGPTSRGPMNRAVAIRSFADYERTFGAPSLKLETGHAVRQFFLNGGGHACVLRMAKIAGAAQLRAAIKVLDGVDLFNLLVMPGNSDPAMLSVAADYCRSRRAVLIVDPPKTAAVPLGVQEFVKSLRFKTGSNVAVYFPWLNIVDPAANAARAIPPGGAVAGIFARTDAARGVWKAPANVAITGVQSLVGNLSTAETEQLNAGGINCIRCFPGRGIRVWGARTLSSDPEWKHVNVRRLLLFLEESIERGTRWAVFEPNNQTLWTNIRHAVENFLISQWRAGAFQGARQSEAFFVRCDRSTMTQADIDAGRLMLTIGVAPIKPAEFVIFRIGQKTAHTK